MKTERFIKTKLAQMSEKTVAISGSTGGIGRELCSHLASLGANLVLVDRNMAKSTRLATELKANFPKIQIRHVQADMADMQSVKEASDQLLSMELDYLILNAGAYSIPRCTCDTGYDNVFQINFISPYYLARRLLPDLKGRGGKIIAVGSIAHNYSKIDELDPDFATRKKASLVYGNAKRFLTYSLFDIGREGGISVAHPGITFTGITDHYPPLIYAIIKHPMKLIFMHPRKACLSMLRAMSDDVGVGEWVGPEVFDVWGMPKVKPLKTASGDEQRKICAIAEEIYNKINIK